MNNVFNLKRFATFFCSETKRLLSQIWLPLLLFMLSGLLFGLCYGYTGVLFNGIGGWKSIGIGGRNLLFTIVFIIFAMILPSKCYGNLTDKKMGSNYLMIPASTFEKTLILILLSVIIIPCLFQLGYGLADLVLCKVDKGAGTPLINIMFSIKNALLALNNSSRGTLESIGLDSFIDNSLFMIDELSRTDIFKHWLNRFLTIFIFQMFYVLGALVFKKAKVTKTILCLIAILIIVVWTGLATGNNAENISEKMEQITYSTQGAETSLYIIPSVGKILIKSLVGLVLCSLAYIRLRRIQH